MSQKVPIDGFKWNENTSQLNKDFMENYNENSDERYFLEVEVKYPKALHDLHNDSAILPEKIKVEKVEKLVANLHDKKEHVTHVRHLTHALNHGLVLKKNT